MRVLREFGRGLRGAAHGRACCGALERSRNVLVRAGGCVRQVPRSLLRVGDDTREHVVDSAAFVLCRAAVDARRQQWVRETDPSTPNLEDSRIQRRRDHPLPILDGMREDVRGGMTERGDDEEPAASVLWERREASLDKLPNRLGNRQRTCAVAGGRRGGRELECEERVAPRRLVDPDQRRPVKRQAEPAADDPADGAQRERRHGQPLDSDRRERRLDCRRQRLSLSTRCDNDNRLIRQAAEREREDVRRRRVEPLRIVNGKDDGAVLRQRA